MRDEHAPNVKAKYTRGYPDGVRRVESDSSGPEQGGPDVFGRGLELTMALAAGTRLGDHYEIIGSLGAGGMGEVYRAADASLKREVAIKILPAAFAGDADRVARFQRDAEVLAALADSATERRTA